MRKVVVGSLIVLAVLAVVLGGLYLLLCGGGRSPRAVGAGVPPPPPPVSTMTNREAASEHTVAAAPPSPARDLAARNAMRQRILDAMHARERAAEDQRESTGREPAPATERREPAGDDGGPAAGSLVDRTGNHEYLVKVMNEDLMPLADECYELALEEQPDLEGMLAVELDIIGEEEIGGVVESVQPAEDNELSHPTLVECVRESILATTLPPPEQGGRDEIMLSLRLSPDNAP
ncbi:MAG: hypothetical protein AAGF11_11640 [Myxococcota bacterium]